MGIPLTAQAAQEAGFKKAGDQEIATAKAAGGIQFDSPQENYICYMGPCSGGYRTICYHTDSGCNNCYTTSEGC